MKRISIILLILLGVFFPSGCDPTRTTLYYTQSATQNAYPPTENVIIFLDSLPTQPYDEFGVIDHSHYIEDIVKAAKANGADGLINIQRYGHPHVRSDSRTGGWDTIWVDTVLSAVMIKFKPK
jgi:hypothetical protein